MKRPKISYIFTSCLFSASAYKSQHLSVFWFVILCQPPLGMSKSFDLSLGMGKNTNFKYTMRISLVKAMAATTTITTILSQDSVGCLFTSLMTRSTGVVHDLHPVMN